MQKQVHVMTKFNTKSMLRKREDVQSIKARRNVMKHAVQILYHGDTHDCKLRKPNEIDRVQSAIAREFTTTVFEIKKKKYQKHETTPTAKDILINAPRIKSFAFATKSEPLVLINATWNFRNDEAVLAMAVSEKSCHIGTADGQVLSLNRDTCQITRHFSFEEAQIVGILARSTGGSLQVALGNGYLYDTSSETPRLVYKPNEPKTLQAIDYRHGLLAMSYQGGELVVMNNLEEPLWSMPSTGNQNAKVVHVFEDVVLHGNHETLSLYDIYDGSLIWSRDLRNGEISSMSVMDNICFVATENKQVIKLDWRSGSVQSYFNVDAVPTSCTYDLLRRVLYVGDSEGSIYAFDVKTGIKQWKMHTTLPFASKKAIKSMHYSHRQLFLAAQSGYCSAVSVTQDAIANTFAKKPTNPVIWNSAKDSAAHVIKIV